MDVQDLVVWGNEPAGLWLLNQFVQVASFVPTTGRGKNENPPPPRVLWIRNEADLEPVAVPTAAARQYGIAHEKSYSVDLVTKHRCLTWNDAAIGGFVPKHPAKRGDVEKALSKNPDLLTWSTGMWKIFGRAEGLSPQSQISAALLNDEWFYWEPWHTLSSRVTTITLPEDAKLERFEKRRDGNVAFHFSGLPDEIVSPRWVLNDSCASIERKLEGTPFESQWFERKLSAHVSSARYPLKLRVERQAIPEVVPPLLCFIDEEVLPEDDSDFWPIQIVKLTDRLEVRFWVKHSSQVSLESMLERFREAMGRAYRVFPYLDRHLLTIDPSLGLETCHSEETRERTLRALEKSGVEIYSLTGFSSATRMKWLHHLLPFTHCHLPYPMGTLQAANDLILRWFGKKRVLGEKAAAPTPIYPDATV